MATMSLEKLAGDSLSTVRLELLDVGLLLLHHLHRSFLNVTARIDVSIPKHLHPR